MIKKLLYQMMLKKASFCILQIFSSVLDKAIIVYTVYNFQHVINHVAHSFSRSNRPTGIIFVPRF